MEGLNYRDTATDVDLPEGTFFDCAVVHLVTTATIDGCASYIPRGVSGSVVSGRTSLFRPATASMLAAPHVPAE